MVDFMNRSPRDRADARVPPPSPPDWPRRLRSPELQKHHIAGIVAEALTHRLPGYDVEEANEMEVGITSPGDASLSAHLGSLWSTLSTAEPEERLALLEPFLGSLIESADALDKGGRPPRKERLVPLVKHQRFFREMDPSVKPVSEKFVADLSIVYAFDHPHSLEIMTDRERRTIGVPKPRLRKLALDNLRRLITDIGQHDDGTAFMLSAGGNFEASLLLLPELWREFATKVEGDLIACAPARDLLLYTGTRTPGGLDTLRRIADRVVEAGAYPVSSSVLRWNGKGWEEYRGPVRVH
jgi:hypothetical protein